MFSDIEHLLNPRRIVVLMEISKMSLRGLLACSLPRLTIKAPEGLYLTSCLITI